MFLLRFAAKRALRTSGVALVSIWCLAGVVSAQTLDPQSLYFRIHSPSERLEMIVNSSRILTLKQKIPRAQLSNEAIARLTPFSPNQIQISALRPGVTQVNLWDERGQVWTVDVIISGDARELKMLLEAEFPSSSLRVRPLANSVVISGFVDRADSISRIVTMSQDYYPRVINNITVGGVQQVLLSVKVMEVSRTKLRTMGFDWANISGNDYFTQGVSGLLNVTSVTELFDSATTAGVATGSAGASMTFGLVDNNNAFFGFLEALRQNNLAKLLAEPKLVTVSGRPASFNVGGEIPIRVPQSLGTVSIEFHQFGTRVDFVPIVLGNGHIRLEVRPSVSEVDPALSVDGVPGFRTRWVDTAVEMKSGQTLALAGLIQERIESEHRGVPWIADLPWVGAAFRRASNRVNEIELVITVKSELVDALDPDQVPECGPGQLTSNPNDIDHYWRGYMEVPNCCSDGSCAQCRHGGYPLEQEVGPEGAYREGPGASAGFFSRPPQSPASAAVGGNRQPGNNSSRRRFVPVGSQSILSNRHTPNKASPTRSTGRATSKNGQPDLIGETGYDVLK